MVTHTWYERGKCSCGYVWTTQGSHSVVCACRSGRIIEGVLSGLNAVTDEAEFKQAVADDLGVDVSDLTLEQGTE